MIADAIQAERDYRSVENQIHDICHRYQRAYRGDYDDWLSEANHAFCRAYNTWDPSRSKLTTWVHWHVWWGLYVAMRDRARKDVRMPRAPLPNDLEGAPERGLAGLLGELSADAALVAGLLLEAPQARPVGARKAVVDFLLGCGWAGRRIAESWEEIGRALAG